MVRNNRFYIRLLLKCGLNLKIISCEKQYISFEFLIWIGIHFTNNPSVLNSLLNDEQKSIIAKNYSVSNTLLNKKIPLEQ